MGDLERQIQELTNSHVEVTLVSNKQEIREFKIIKTLKITKAINDHVRVWFSGTIAIPDGISDKTQYIRNYLNELNLDQWEIHVKTMKIKQGRAADATKTPPADAAKELFFLGLVTNVAITAVNDAFDISIEGMSYTYKLDIAFENRSFQNGNMTFKELINKVIGDTAICADLEQQTATIKRLFVQYKVTKWGFLARMASWQNSGIVADCLESKPKFCFRVPDQSQQKAIMDLNPVEYQVVKNVREFMRYRKNPDVKDRPEASFIAIEVFKCNQVLELGAKVKFQGVDLYVREAVTEWIGGALQHRYTLVMADGLKQKPVLNVQIAGVSVEGKVIAVGKDFVKVQLDEFELEKKAELAAADLWPFVYASFYTAGEKSGWYCMPETGDHVKVYFPTNNEENAFVMASIRKEKQKGKVRIGNPDIKYLRTGFEKVLVMGEEEIILTCFGKDQEKVELRLNDDSKHHNTGLINIESFGTITITAAGNLQIYSDQNLKISADQKIEMHCKASSLKLDGETRIYGEPMKAN